MSVGTYQPDFDGNGLRVGIVDLILRDYFNAGLIHFNPPRLSFIRAE